MRRRPLPEFFPPTSGKSLPVRKRYRKSCPAHWRATCEKFAPDTSGSFRAPISGFHGAYFRFQRLGFDPKSKIKVTVGGRRGKKGREGGRERGRGRERGGDHRPNLHMVNCWMESVELGSTRSTMRANRVTGREKIKGRSFEYVNEWGGRCGGVGPLGGGMSRPYYS